MLFKNGTVFYRGTFQALDLRVENGKIIEIGAALSSQGDLIDCAGRYVLPGLIDIHTHGCAGYDFSTATPREIETMRRYYLSHGVTGVAATTMTMGIDPYRLAMKNIRSAMAGPSEGCRLLGINMEGPFLGKARKGAHDPAYLIPIDTGLFEELDTLSGNAIKIVNLDPDLDGAMEFIQRHKAEKILSIAHTACTYETAMNAFEHGCNHITHLFNAMNGLHHREPGILGALADSPVFAELITDGVHIHPAVVRLMFGLCPEKLVIISDSMCACGLNDGTYVLGGLAVTVKDGKATLADGTIAGSTTNVYDCMKRAVGFGVPPELALESATRLAAESLGMEQEFGRIEAGLPADLVVADRDFSIRRVYLGGKAAAGL